MIQNKIYHISDEDAAKVTQKAKNSSNTHFVELQGKEIQSWKEYISKIEDTFKLPAQWTNNIDGYNDWMRDLDWLEKDSYVLIVYGYKDFLKQDSSLKNIIMDGFANLILPFWQEEVENCVVGGKAKPFNIYLVD